MTMIYEDVFFYLDLTKSLLKKKDLIKVIKRYISEKNKMNINGHYGLLIFQQEEGNPVFIIDKKGSGIIENAIEENWKSRPKKQSFFENGLFYIFSYIAEMIRKKAKNYRIIVISDTPTDISEDYANALFNLVSKIKNFPTFIDIIRISPKNIKLFIDDVKLNILVNDTKGHIYYIYDKKEFERVMENLIEMKTNGAPINKLEKIKISKQDYAFYSRLAEKLGTSPLDQTGLKCYFCKDEICPVCTEVKDIPRTCVKCGAAFHNCCAINYALENNIGIPHIFRCPQCDILLQVNQDEIVKLEDDTKMDVEMYLGDSSFHQTSNQLSHPEPTSIKVMQKESDKTTTLKIGGYFGKFYTIKKDGDKIIYKKLSKEEVERDYVMGDELKNHPAIWKPSLSSKPNQTSMECPKCGKVLDEADYVEFCPYCGNQVKHR
jgi:rubrerythrin